MGRTVVGDESQLEAQVDSIFRSGAPVQVGILVGKLGTGSSRDLVFALVPTPPKDGEEAATLGPSDPQGSRDTGARKGNKGKPASDGVPVQIATDWVAEHARQVSRMLLGGLHVVGIYLFSSEGSFRSSLAVLWKAVTAVAAVILSGNDGVDSSEYLLLHISSSPRRLSCRSCPGNAPYSATILRPCEWKTGKLLDNLQEFACTYSVDIRYPVIVDQPDRKLESLRKYLYSSVAAEAKRLETAQAIVDGKLVKPDDMLGSGNVVHAVEFIQPIDGGAATGSIRHGRKMKGRVFFKGDLHARAYAVVREPLSRAVADLKGDIVSSLRSRLELLVDEAEEAEEDARAQDKDADVPNVPPPETLLSTQLSMDVKEHSVAMPRRVLVPWLEGTMICDYMLPDESLEDVQERCMDLLGLEQSVDISSFIEVEILGLVPEVVQPAPAASPAPQTSRSTNTNLDRSIDQNVVLKDKKTSSFSFPLAFVGAVLTVMLGLLLSRFLMQKQQ
ncbi:hypothetical protein R1flu_001966 [Riccia fluitans]|uniref:Uncharacterized protein n=1 Tax=Riccia fluitans TaxID=41844 RepID=A0ABD1Y4S7_9MARC